MDSGQLEAEIEDNLLTLRREWKWAAFCQFFFTFEHLFNMPDVTIVAIEEDLARSTTMVLPRIMHRLVYTLTQDRKVSLQTWQTILRKQYFKRNPELNPIGAEPETTSYSDDGDDKSPSPPPESPSSHTSGKPEASSSRPTPERTESVASPKGDPCLDNSPVATVSESRDWLHLDMLEKLSSMHLVMEWQFQNPTRLRSIMRDDDEEAYWRIEPIGYDSKSNAYWLIGEDRLWVQRSRIPSTRDRKRKRPTTAAKKITKLARKEATFQRNPTVSHHGINAAGRSAKMVAKQKLANHAKDVILSQQENDPLRATSLYSGTRASARLRGAPNNDGWQSIPSEWLEVDANQSNSLDRKKTGLEGDESVSDLTELSDDEEEKQRESDSENQGDEQEPPKREKSDAPDSESESADKVEEPALTNAQAFIEWETICVTLPDWEHVGDRWSRSTHYAEKALFKRLTKEISPPIIEAMKELQRKKEREEAVVHRKRSSRIAVKESVLEEQRAAAKKKNEEQESKTRAQRLEARLQKEELEAQRKETARAQRQREREEREEREELEELEALKISAVIQDLKSEPKRHVERPITNSRQKSILRMSGQNHPPARSISEDWELDCEICHRRGKNQDEGVPMMSCGSCGKWQHIACHDRSDHLAGREKRDWDKEEFHCQRCQILRVPKIKLGIDHPNGRDTLQQQSTQVSYRNGANSTHYGHDRQRPLIPPEVNYDRNDPSRLAPMTLLRATEYPHYAPAPSISKQTSTYNRMPTEAYDTSHKSFTSPMQAVQPHHAGHLPYSQERSYSYNAQDSNHISSQQQQRHNYQPHQAWNHPYYSGQAQSTPPQGSRYPALHATTPHMPIYPPTTSYHQSDPSHNGGGVL